MSGVVVKGLEWAQAALVHRMGLIVRVAPSALGEYRVLKGSQGRFDGFLDTGQVTGSFDTIEQAQSALQADLERRILSSINPTSATDLGEVMPVEYQQRERRRGSNDPAWSRWYPSDKGAYDEWLAGKYGPDSGNKMEYEVRPLYTSPPLSPVPTAGEVETPTAEMEYEDIDDLRKTGLASLMASPAQPMQEMHELEPVAWMVEFVEDGAEIIHVVFDEPQGHYKECATPLYALARQGGVNEAYEG